MPRDRAKARLLPEQIAMILTDVAGGATWENACAKADVASSTIRARRAAGGARAEWDHIIGELRKLLADGGTPAAARAHARRLLLGSAPGEREMAESELRWADVETALRTAAPAQPEDYWLSARERAAALAGVATPEEIPADRVLAIGWSVFRDPRMTDHVSGPAPQEAS